jgi:transcriptional regulator with XRE-family HTH domain
MGRAKTREQQLHEKWGRRLRFFRKDRGLSQAQLAKRVRVHQGRISEWETGTAPPPDRMKLRLAEVLGCPVEEIFAWPEFVPPEHAEAVA